MLTSPNHLVQGFQAWLGLSLNTYENYEWVLTNPNHLVARVRKPKISRAWVKIKTRRKLLLVPRRKPKMLLLLNSAKLLTRWPPKWKLRIWGHFFYFYLFSFAVVFVVFFFKGNLPYFLYDQWKDFSFIFYIFIVYTMGFSVIAHDVDLLPL